MKYNTTMNLLSISGYAMPFELSEDAPLEITLGYGKQIHPATGVKFFHNGTDFKVSPASWLKALATGKVTGVGQDSVHGTKIQVTYTSSESSTPCRYDVIYGHISHVYCQYGQRVSAGDNIAMSDDKLHIEVVFNGESINPVDFLVMIRDNLIMQSQKQMDGNNPEIATMDMNVHTPYDQYQSEIDMLYSKYLLNYFVDSSIGRYRVPQRTSDSLSSLIKEAMFKNFLFEVIPSSFNPAGLGQSSVDWQGRMQTTLLDDFLLYLALKHGVFLSHLNEDEKKKLLTGR